MNSPAGCRRKAHQKRVAQHMRVCDSLPDAVRDALQSPRTNLCPMCTRDLVKCWGVDLTRISHG
jgi:hypothetical protein